MKFVSKHTVVGAVLLSLVISSFTVAQPVNAQTSDNEYLRTLIAQLLERITAMRAQINNTWSEPAGEYGASDESVGILGALPAESVGGAEVSVSAAGGHSETRLQQSCFDLVWAPGEKELVDHNKWEGRGYTEQNRIVYDKDGPGDGNASLKSRAWESEPALMASLRIPLDEALERKSNVARLVTTMYIPKNSGFSPANAKMMLGLWGKENGTPLNSTNCFTLCSPPENPLYPQSYDTPGADSRQVGFSVRVSRQTVDGESSEIHGPKIYSYHLNRRNAPVIGDVVYGESTVMNVRYPTNRWFKMIMDVRLDSWDWANNRSNANGFIDLYMVDMDGDIIGQVHKENLIFRDNPDWHIYGPFLLDVWKNSENNEFMQPTKNSRIYYRDTKMYLIKEGVYPGQCMNW